jgi:DNA mismatch repair protein MutS
LNELADNLPRIRNYSIAIKEHGNKIIFLRKLVPGGSQHSFGIHVAQLAGMPASIVARAGRILEQLERQHITEGVDEQSDRNGAPAVRTMNSGTVTAEAMQLSIFETSDPTAGKLREALDQVAINSMTPIECMMKLQELKQIVDEQ